MEARPLHHYRRRYHVDVYREVFTKGDPKARLVLRNQIRPGQNTLAACHEELACLSRAQVGVVRCELVLKEEYAQ